jgi:hypothetical protein
VHKKKHLRAGPGGASFLFWIVRKDKFFIFGVTLLFSLLATHTFFRSKPFSYSIGGYLQEGFIGLNPIKDKNPEAYLSTAATGNT